MIGAVFATDDSNGFGNKGRIPWHVPADYQHFKNVTMGGKIVMGKGTFESLPKLLPGRDHIVVSSTLESGDGYKVYTTPEEVLANEGNNFWVIGGPSLILAFSELVGYDYVYHSVIYGTHECDVVFAETRSITSPMLLKDKQLYSDFEVVKYVSKSKF